MGVLRTIAGVCALALFAALIWLSQTYLTPDGLGLFDGRVLGYSYQEAQAYLTALSPEGRATYLGVTRQLDTAFPIVFTLFLVLMAWPVGAGRPLFWRALLVLAPLGYLVFDLAENAAVALLLGTNPVSALAASDVARASFFTQLKYASLTIGVVLLVSLKALRR